jgi:hypothetical protein
VSRDRTGVKPADRRPDFSSGLSLLDESIQK